MPGRRRHLRGGHDKRSRRHYPVRDLPKRARAAAEEVYGLAVSYGLPESEDDHGAETMRGFVREAAQAVYRHMMTTVRQGGAAE